MKDRLSGGKADPLILRGKQIHLFLVPKWRLTCRVRIQVLGAQLLDPVEEQSAQISYRILLTLVNYGRKKFHKIDTRSAVRKAKQLSGFKMDFRIS